MAESRCVCDQIDPSDRSCFVCECAKYEIAQLRADIDRVTEERDKARSVGEEVLAVLEDFGWDLAVLRADIESERLAETVEGCVMVAIYRALRARAAGSGACDASETTDEMIARHNRVNARLRAEAIEASLYDDEGAEASGGVCADCHGSGNEPEIGGPCEGCNGTGRSGGHDA